MSALKSSLLVLLATSIIFASGALAEAQNRGTTHRTNQGMSAGGTAMQSSIQSAQNQARAIAARQHQIWLAHRLKKNAAEKAAKAKAAEAKAAGESKESISKSTTNQPSTKATSTSKTATPSAK